MVHGVLLGVWERGWPHSQTLFTGRHWCHSRDKIYQPLCLLQVIDPPFPRSILNLVLLMLGQLCLVLLMLGQLSRRGGKKEEEERSKTGQWERLSIQRGEGLQSGQDKQSLSLLPVFVRSDHDSWEVIGQLRPEQTNPIPANTEIKCTYA